MRDAVVVGIDTYPDAPLHACVRDAREMAACLTLEQYDFNCKVLLNSQASRQGILEALSELAYGREDREMLLFYFAGHGEVLGSAGHLVTHDAQNYDPGISLAQLAQLMESASQHYSHVVAILDCCHAGSSHTWTNSRPLRVEDVDREVATVNESRCILAACRPEETAKELLDSSHGVYTSALIDGMLSDAVDHYGQVTLLSLHEYAARVVPGELQTPVLKGDVAGTVALGRGFEPRIGRPLEKAELSKNLAKAHTLVDEQYALHREELSDHRRRVAGGAKRCAQRLEQTLRWFEETQKDLPDIRRNPNWKDLHVRLLDHRRSLAEISLGQEMAFGRVSRLIGHGGYGHVWEVETESGEMVAYKVFHGNELDDDVKVQRFRNGYQTMKGLDDAHVVAVREFSDVPLGFVMDFVPGENLRNYYLDRSDSEAVVRLMLDIAHTVEHAHSRDVRHRDIKPENIIVVQNEEGNPEPYLTDFDLSYHETNRTITTSGGAVGGVIFYAAPEQLHEPNTAAAREATVDVFSLGQLFFYILTGRNPNSDDFEKNRQQLIQELGEQIDDRAATEIVDLYVASTHRDPKLRPQKVAEMVATLGRAEAFILAASGTDALAEEDLCRRIAYIYSGLGNFQAGERSASFTSRSGQIAVVVRLKAVHTERQNKKEVAVMELELSVTEKITLPHLKSGSSARGTLNNRTDKIIRQRYGNRVTRHPGSKGQYQVFFEIKSVPFSNVGAADVHEVLVTCLSAIENW